MSHYVNIFLETELTVIPGLLRGLLGAPSERSNALCNVPAWMLLVWFVLHGLFDLSFNALLRRMGCRECSRVRLERALWGLGFAGSTLVFALSKAAQEGLFPRSWRDDCWEESKGGSFVLGFIMFSTYFLHSALWEALRYGDGLSAGRQGSFCVLLCVLQGLGLVKASIFILILSSIVNIFSELARCAAVLKKQGPLSTNVFLKIFLVLAIVALAINYVLAVPFVTFTIARKMSPQLPNLLPLLLPSVGVWLIFEIVTSIAFKLAVHWWFHGPSSSSSSSFANENACCGGDAADCALFPPRDDATYNLLLYRKELKERDARMMSMRKTKKKAVYQTLKCVVALKRKLKAKREATKSDDSSEENDDEDAKGEEEKAKTDAGEGEENDMEGGNDAEEEGGEKNDAEEEGEKNDTDGVSEKENKGTE